MHEDPGLATDTKPASRRLDTVGTLHERKPKPTTRATLLETPHFVEHHSECARSIHGRFQEPPSQPDTAWRPVTQKPRKTPSPSTESANSAKSVFAPERLFSTPHSLAATTRTHRPRSPRRSTTRSGSSVEATATESARTRSGCWYSAGIRSRAWSGVKPSYLDECDVPDVVRHGGLSGVAGGMPVDSRAEGFASMHTCSSLPPCGPTSKHASAPDADCGRRPDQLSTEPFRLG